MTAVSTGDKAVTILMLDKSLFAKIGRVCDPFFLDVTAKLKRTFSDGVIQYLSSLHFILELVMFTQNWSFVPKFDSVPFSTFFG